MLYLVFVDNYTIVIYHAIICKYNIKIILNSQSWDLNFFMAMNTKISHKLSHNYLLICKKLLVVVLWLLYFICYTTHTAQFGHNNNWMKIIQGTA